MSLSQSSGTISTMLGCCGTFVLLVTQNVRFQQQQRGMSSLKAIVNRIKAVKSVQKLTRTVKMIAGVKYAKAQRELKQSRPLGREATKFYENAKITAPDDQPRKLFIAITSDRGLCGPTNSNIARLIRNELKNDKQNVKVVCVGDKSRIILRRLYSKNIILSGKGVGRRPPSFNDASTLAVAILNSEYAFDSGHIVYNRFRNVTSYATTTLPVYSLSTVMTGLKLPVDDPLDGAIESYLEFSLVLLLFYALKEGACSEHASRMNAMAQATQSAEKIITGLSLLLNRTRQALITRELIEIISGASLVSHGKT